ncbi:MAG: sigma-70 family RNA polymerase sigma factor [Clostridia bacterium]|nr:sigma-70 family RNA polymerase sigma factor [Clostridia bacterium]
MSDKEIIELLFNRDERAIGEIQLSYYNYCHNISYNILHDEEDVKECINESLNAIWNCIPPHRPDNLKTFIGKIVRKISISAFRKNTAAKRIPSGNISPIDEFEDLISDGELNDKLEQAELSRAISKFLSALPKTERNVMIRRYWYNDSIKDICDRFSFGESKVKVMLNRTRDKLRKFLKKEGYLM